MFDFKRMSSGLVLGSVLGTCLVTQGVSAVDEVSNVSTQVNDDVDSSEGNKEIVEKSAGLDSVAVENVGTEDKNTEIVNKQVNDDVDSSGDNEEIVKSPTGSGNVVDEDDDTEDKNSEKSSVDDGGSLVKYLFAGVFGAIVGNASLLGMNWFLGKK